MTPHIISTGTAVTFDSDQGPQSGTVHEIKTDISNGAQIALIHVPGTYNAMPWTMPVNEIHPIDA